MKSGNRSDGAKPPNATLAQARAQERRADELRNALRENLKRRKAGKPAEAAPGEEQPLRRNRPLAKRKADPSEK